ncbi:MAG: hypothetical protein DWH81_15800 [Planctomycetota bacterium]|nr:MAG: hypothetical protein DWH81_15800 [Planctomycetota bacterium]
MRLAEPTLALDLTAQLWPLVNLIVAIFQPAVVLLLCGGVVVASTHLLAMLGTQWGSRRVTGKALIFSLVIHASLLCGVVALVPEYQLSKVTAFESDHAVEISTDLNSDENAFEELRSSPEADRQPWEQLTSSQPAPLDRTQVEVPETPQADVTSATARQPVDVVPIPDPVFEPLPPAPQETGELAKADLPQEYNPATFQPTMDTVDPVESSQAPSREAPTLARSTPNVSATPSDTALMQPEQRPQILPNKEIRLGVEEDLPSALPSPEATPLARMQREQAPARTGPAPAQVSDTPDMAAPASQPQVSQSGAPAALPRRSTPRMTPKVEEGLAKIDQPSMSGKPGAKLSEESREEASRPFNTGAPGDTDNPGEEALPDLVPLKGLLAAPLENSTPAQYQLRSNEMREQAVEQFGGNAESEAAVDLALHWLASIQNVDGYWDGDSYGAGKGSVTDAKNATGRDSNIGRNADTGLTALAILAFLGKQNTLEEGQYSENVTRALRWLIYQQGKSPQNIDGYLGGNAAEVAGVYSHAMATFAIAEAYAMTKDPEQSRFLLEPLQKAIRFTLACQLEDGGWRYKRGQQGGGDMSIFGWHLMSLKSAQAAGMEIPLANRQKMILFLQQRGQGRAGGLASYRRNESPTVAMTAESLFCKQMLGLPREHPSCDEAVKFLLTNPPTRQSMNLYSWYYSTLALYQYGGDAWEQWNSRLRDLLIAEQVTTGEFAGSWEPRDQWGGYGGRIYATTFATLTLEVYYRYLPLYRTTAPASAIPQSAEPTGETSTAPE